MNTSNRTTFSRITVLAPRIRVDVALPSDVAIVDLMPNLFDLTGATAGDGGAAHGGWCLSRIGEPELDASRSLTALEVLDGELLHLRPRRDILPAPIYDEIVDAIAIASAESSRGWDARLGHHLGLTVAGVALAFTAFALWQLPQSETAVQLALGLVVLLIAVGASVARAGGDAPAAVLLASGSLPLAVVGAVRLVPGGPDADNLLLGSTALLVASILALVALGAGGIVFAGGATIGALGGLTFLVATLVTAPGASFAAGLLVAACAGLLYLPRLASRFAALPMPIVPMSAADFSSEADTNFTDIIRRTRVAQQYLTGLYAGAALLIGGSAVFLSRSGGLWAVLLIFTGTSVLLLRARGLNRSPHVLALLLPGITAGLISLVVLSRELPTDQSTWLPIGAIVLTAVAIAIGVVFPQRRFAPTTKRLLDIVEALLITALLPLALAVMDLYRVFRHL